jgi:hypothetical protein
MIHTHRKLIEFDHLPVEFPILLQSDIHVMSPQARLDVVAKELQHARKINARVNINGDLFDAILPADVKRYVPSAVDSDQDDLLDVAVNHALKLYGPYADLIDVVGMGNHEGAAIKHHSTNLIKRFVEGLNALGGNVAYGGYSGYITYFFRNKAELKHSCSYRIRYHHGSGGASIVTRGTIDFTRMAAWISDADLLWMGHKHFQKWERFNQERISSQDTVYEHTVDAIMTGGYIDQMGKADSYATIKNLQHLPVGGAFVNLVVSRQTADRKHIAKLDTLRWSA